MKCAVVVVVILLCAVKQTASDLNKEFKHTNIILIGATGDLAQKYLWRSLFEFFGKHYKHGQHAFSIYACARKSPDAGREFLSDVLLKIITCVQDDVDCKSTKKKFVEAIQYHQLKTEKHYEKLAQKINENTQSMYGLQGSPVTPEDGRLIYLSIPPSAYVKTVRLVNQYLRPIVGRPWFRVVIEKPFGHDYNSAKDLMKKLDQHLAEKEIYLMDHYLGKTVVREILPFRYRNKMFEPLWNRHHVERVEIVLKEKLDVQARLSFYDETGVVRDVMQNHLTEMATLVGMDLPDDSGIIRDILNSKVSFLQQVEPLTNHRFLIGQYASYTTQCQQELKHAPNLTTTPTFACAVFVVNTARWRGVPFVLMSGKRLDEKLSYVRILFKDNTFHVQRSSEPRSPPAQIVFRITSGNQFEVDMIAVSKQLPRPQPNAEWQLEEDTSDCLLFGEDIRNMYRLVPKTFKEAYTLLLEAAYLGERHYFVDRRSLLASWKIWDPVLKEPQKGKLRIYEGRTADVDRLDFQILGDGTLTFVKKEDDGVVEIPDVKIPGIGLPKMGYIPATFRNERLVTGQTPEVIAKLAENLEQAARTAISDRGSFHLACPGGSSPVMLFEHLAALMPQFPWQQTHLWQTDERCLPQDHEDSNFHQIDTKLIRHIPIPFLNIHPMPVHLTHEPCADSDIGSELYEAKLKRLVINATLDFVILGLGEDGHIASLFPNQTTLSELQKAVVYSKASPDNVSPKRMTLTLPAINRSHSIAILALGQRKHNILELLATEEATDVLQYPVIGLKSSNQTHLTWYVDKDALFGEL